jgi:hypothetical protein
LLGEKKIHAESQHQQGYEGRVEQCPQTVTVGRDVGRCLSGSGCCCCWGRSGCCWVESMIQRAGLGGG